MSAAAADSDLRMDDSLSVSNQNGPAARGTTTRSQVILIVGIDMMFGCVTRVNIKQRMRGW
jgi:hypothetical protein